MHPQLLMRQQRQRKKYQRLLKLKLRQRPGSPEMPVVWEEMIRIFRIM